MSTFFPPDGTNETLEGTNNNSNSFFTENGVDLEYTSYCKAEADRAKEEADRAKEEADRAEDEADRAQGISDNFTVETDTDPHLGGDLKVNGYRITAEGANNIHLQIDGSGTIQFNTDIWPEIPGTNAQALLTDGAGNLYWGNTSALPGSRIQDAGNTSYVETETGGVGVTLADPVSIQILAPIVQATNDVDYRSSLGDVFIQDLKYPKVDGLAGEVLVTDGAGNLTFGVVSGMAAWGAITGDINNQTDLMAILNNKAELVHTHDTADIVSGTFADARISESNVTQHEAALELTYTQITDAPWISDLSTHSITELSDVSVGVPDVGNYLIWSGSEYVPGLPPTGVQTFLDLTDTPATYLSQGSKILAITAGEDGIEFITPAGAGLVDSVFGRIGDVFAQNGDYSLGLMGDVSDATPLTRNYIIADGAVWTSTKPLLDDASDVDIAGATNGEVLTYNSGTGNWEPAVPQVGGNVDSVFGRTGVVVAEEADYDLTLLGDVEIVAPVANQLLYYFQPLQRWINGNGSSFGLLDNVQTPLITIDTAGLRWNDSLGEWQSSTDFATAAQGALADTALQDITNETLGDLGNVDTSNADSPAQLLTFDGTSDWDVTFIIDDAAVGTNDLWSADRIINYFQQENDDKADKVTGAVDGNFAGLDATGNLTDTGFTDTDFAKIGVLTDGLTPPGGAIQYVLKKDTATDYDYSWQPEAAANPVWGTIIGTLSDQTDLQLELDGKANTVHTHVEADVLDLDKYTQLEVDGLLNGKANTVHTHVEVDVLDLDRIRWKNEWSQTTYFKNDMVRDGLWAMVANKTTTERAAPQLQDEGWGLEDATWSTSTNSIAVTGTDIVLNADTAGSISAYRAYLPIASSETFHYTVAFVDLSSGTPVSVDSFRVPDTTPVGWIQRNISPHLVGKGGHVQCVVHAIRVSVSGSSNWTYLTGGALPPSGAITSNEVLELVNISKTDADSNVVDLSLLATGTQIHIQEGTDTNRYQTWESTGAVVDQGGYWEIPAILVGFGNDVRNNRLSAVTLEEPTGVPAEYVFETDFWVNNPGINATVQGFIGTDYSNIAYNNNGYGGDVYGGLYEASADWEIVALSGGGGSSGSGGGGEVGEAPVDGTPYSRQDRLWVNTINDITTSTLGELSNVNGVVDGAQNNYLLRSDGTEWLSDLLISDTTTGTDRLWTSTKINTELGTKSDVGHTHVMADITDSTWISDVTNEPIEDLSNVSANVPTDRQVLQWDNGGSNYKPVTITNELQEVGGFTEAYTSAEVIDAAVYNFHKSSQTANYTFVINNIPDGAYSCFFEIESDGFATITWPAGITWVEGNPPALLPDDDWLHVVLTTTDNGTAWIGSHNVSDVAASWGSITGVISNQTDLQLELDNKSPITHTHEIGEIIQPVVETSATAITTALGQEGNYYVCTAATAVTVTVSDNATEAFDVGTIINYEQAGVGQLTFVPAVGVTLTSPETLQTRQQGAVVSIIKTNTDAWSLYGDLELDIQVASVTNDALAGHANEAIVVNGAETSLTFAAIPTAAIYGTEYQYAQDLAESTTNSTTPVNKLQMVTPALPAGTYEIELNYAWQHSSASASFMGRLTENAVVLGEVSVEPKDTTNYTTEFTKGVRVLAGGVYTYEVDYWSENGSTAAIKNVLMTIKRVA